MTTWLEVGRLGPSLAAGRTGPRRRVTLTTLASPVARSRGSELVWLSLVVAVGAFLRLWQLNAVGFNSDESVYAGQAAGIAGEGTLSGLFPVFRAHPLLFQTLLSIGLAGGVSDIGARVCSVLFGLATIVVVYNLGKALYGPRTALAAALFVALMPYHVVVTRQVLLDGPQTFFALLGLYCFVRSCQGRSSRWLYASAAVFGLTVLTKEIAAVLVLAIIVFGLLRWDFWPGRRPVMISAAIVIAICSAYPLSLVFSGRRSTGESYLAWQFFRRPNHDFAFYWGVVPPAVGPLVLVLAAAGLWLLRKRITWREWLLGCWIVVPVAFFEMWPTKGYQYLLPVAPVIAILAARTVAETVIPWFSRRGRAIIRGLVVLGCALSLVVPTWTEIDPAPDTAFLAGSGGVSGGREAGQWVRTNLPAGSRLLAVGPSMANIVQFYGLRRAYGLSVSPNPLSRNPSYVPIENPDRQMRNRELHYLLWDVYSAQRAPFFSQQLLRFVHKYHAVPVHTETIPVRTKSGALVRTPVIIIYEVRP